MRRGHVMRRTCWRIILFACLGCCRGSAPTGAIPDSGPRTAQDEANFCQTEIDCSDLGPDCPSTCHLLINTRSPRLMEVVDHLSTNRLLVLEGKCTQDCTAPNWGATCSHGRCRQRDTAPDASICWDPEGTRIACLELLRRFRAESRCQALCGGKLSYQDRAFRERRPIDDQRHSDVDYIVSYLSCSDCPTAP